MFSTRLSLAVLCLLQLTAPASSLHVRETIDDAELIARALDINADVVFPPHQAQKRGLLGDVVNGVGDLVNTLLGVATTTTTSTTAAAAAATTTSSANNNNNNNGGAASATAATTSTANGSGSGSESENGDGDDSGSGSDNTSANDSSGTTAANNQGGNAASNNGNQANTAAAPAASGSASAIAGAISANGVCVLLQLHHIYLIQSRPLIALYLLSMRCILALAS